MTSAEAHRAVDAVWRIESARVVGALSRAVRDVGLAEELAQDALVAALEQWPDDGVPANPAAWLTAVAKRRAIDRARRGERFDLVRGELERRLEFADDPSADAASRAADGEIADDVLRLLFVVCHPALSREAQVALTLRLVGGLRTEEIASAYLIPHATVAQRIVRAKRTLREARVTFEAPDAGPERDARLGGVLQVVYLIFNEGYSATAGEQLTRPALCEDALRLGRMLATLMPDEAEAHALVALMELQASRLRARLDPSGDAILLLDQDRARWDGALIESGLAALARAEAFGSPLGPYALQASIAACHARARLASDTDWPKIAALYETLAAVMPSPIVELNRAVALGMAFGPQAGLELVGALAHDPALAKYRLLPAVRGDLLERSARFEEASAEFERAASLSANARERATLVRRAAACAEKSRARRLRRGDQADA